MSDTAQRRYEINIVAQVATPFPMPAERLADAVSALLEREGVAPGASVSIVLADDATVRALNQQYRGIDRPTDVLSFRAEASGLPAEPELGDLIIALPYLERQAEAEGHAFADELLLAVIHGTLHLLGYDHDSPSSQDRMWTLQAEALAAAGVTLTVPRYEFDADAPGDVGQEGS